MLKTKISLISFFIHRGSADRQQQEGVDTISYEYIDLVEDWVMEKEFSSEDPAKKGWMDIDPPLGNAVHLGPQIDDVQALGAGIAVVYTDICMI